MVAAVVVVLLEVVEAVVVVKMEEVKVGVL